MFSHLVNTAFIAGPELPAQHKQMVDNNEFDDRWKRAMAHLAARHPPVPSRAALAKLLQISEQRLNNWVNQRKRVSNNSRLEFERETGISVDWLNEGHGEMLIPPNHVAEAVAHHLRPLRLWDDAADLSPDQYVMLDALEYRLSAGHGGFDPGSTETAAAGAAFRADFAANHGWKRKTHFSMRANGDSMEPTIQDGAPVVVAIDENRIRSGRIYAILVDGEPLLKRLDKLPGGMIRVRSDNSSNPAYAPFEIPESSIQVIGRAVWTPVML